MTALSDNDKNSKFIFKSIGVLQLPQGRDCIEHYSLHHRFCVFSHDELVCKMASNPDSLDFRLAAATYQDMLRMVESEMKLRKTLLDRVRLNFPSICW